MDKNQARLAFLQLVRSFGLQWGPSVPSEAYASMQEISAVLSPSEKREALRAQAVTDWLRS